MFFILLGKVFCLVYGMKIKSTINLLFKTQVLMEVLEPWKSVR